MGQKDIISNLYKQGCNHQHISDISKIKFGESAYMSSTIYKWMKEAKFNLPLANRRLDSEEAKNTIDEQLLLIIQQILEDEPLSSIRSIASVLRAPKFTIHRYMTVHLKLVYRYTRWLPHFSNIDQKNVRIQNF
ncbi:histone-lysine N-methyltransferase SETMAR-like [Histomonas meleagridis]|uniref:histone-lysine N-methyltransferase SETMAR-like n=1 Tax=Histomonas meleagridis TaxID=135588 RepID=UPI003559D52A|nr:histone-lysine N-methyltransferase SETMAR-like [Histomonas meleagridis]KAH0804825.1 histone-lysine N-methyltransferase SETMAR-like [Histomonas meleagridis]